MVVRNVVTAVQATQSVNEDYEPNSRDVQVLDVLHEGRANPKWIREETGLKKQRVNDALERLQNAGWVNKLTRGLYELDDDVPDWG